MKINVPTWFFFLLAFSATRPDCSRAEASLGISTSAERMAIALEKIAERLEKMNNGPRP